MLSTGGGLVRPDHAVASQQKTDQEGTGITQENRGGANHCKRPNTVMHQGAVLYFHLLTGTSIAGVMLDMPNLYAAYRLLLTSFRSFYVLLATTPVSTPLLSSATRARTARRISTSDTHGRPA